MRCDRSDYLEFCEGTWYPCCSGWVNISKQGGTAKEALESEEFWKFKNSIEDGSYRYCNGSCPTMLKATNIGDTRKYPGQYRLSAKKINAGPDHGCSLYCLSCRREQTAGVREQARVNFSILERSLKSAKTETITLSSNGDPLFSPEIRNWLYSFRKEEYPELKTISLRTNLQLFTERFWEKVSDDAKSLIRSVQVSVDAATKETYEKLRRGASWELLQSNLDFLSKVSTIEEIYFSFVVQKYNVFEIEPFHTWAISWGKENNKNVSIIYQEVEYWESGVDQDVFERHLHIYADLEIWKQASNSLRKLNRISTIRDFYQEHPESRYERTIV